MKFKHPGLKTRSFNIYQFSLVFLMVMVFLFSACSQQPEIFTPDSLTQEVVELIPEPTLSLEFTPQLIPTPYLVWLDPTLPETIRDLITQQAEFNITANKEEALLSFSSARDIRVGSWTYLLVAPFYSRLDDIPLSALQSMWETGSIDIPGYKKLLMSDETKIHISQFWGLPFSDAIEIIEPDDILDKTWFDTDSLAIIPFEELAPSYKVISIDNKIPLTFSSQDETYPLIFPIFLTIPDPSVLHPIELTGLNNYDRSKLTSIVLTGVTAMVRDTAFLMEENGVLYPGEDIRDILLSADITHINNEVPFAEDCPPPDSNQDSLSFCSSDSYIDLLVSIGTDIVELSGDHLSDHGPEAMYHSIDLYDQHGLIIYGGGRTLQEGLQPYLLEHNGNKIAFIGCNGKSDERYALASATVPGASKCDFEWMIPEISRLTEDGYTVIATMQHEEVDSFFPIALQLFDFRSLSEAGASIVSGSQAHHPQGIEISEFKFIHYGLGNLFFDQWHLARYNPEQHINKDKAFIDFHYIYDGRYINTRLIPLQFIDNARPRLMTPEEKDQFYDDFYEASKWNNRWIYLFPSHFFDYVDN